MEYRFVGIHDGKPVSYSKEVQGHPELEAYNLTLKGVIVFGWGPGEKIPRVRGREDLVLAMNIIAELHVTGAAHYWISDRKAYEAWKADKPVSTKRKEFAVDFESLSDDGKLLTKEPIDPVVAWKATLAACGARGE
jgi:hypothetical protein